VHLNLQLLVAAAAAAAALLLLVLVDPAEVPAGTVEAIQEAEHLEHLAKEMPAEGLAIIHLSIKVAVAVAQAHQELMQ
jgi:hypothetical protein